MIAGPLRAAWYQRSTSACQLRWPGLLSLGLLLLILTFFTQIAHPFTKPWLYKADPAVYSSPREHSPMLLNDHGSAKSTLGPYANAPMLSQDASKHAGHMQTESGSSQERDARHTKFLREALGLASILLQSFILAGPVLFVIVYCELPRFGLTGLLTTHIALIITQSNNIEPILIIAGLLTGLLGDVFRVRVGSFDASKTPLRVFAFLLPSVLFGLFFAFLSLTQGLGWSVHLWMGSLSMAGVVGLLTSYLLVPPTRMELAE
jgi:hypothetical protein